MPAAPNIPDFRLIKPIGEGGVGEIWLGLDLLENYRAIKIIRQSQFKRLKDYQAEFHGIRKYAPLSQNHPGLIEIHHAGIRDEEGFYYYIMSLADDLEHGTNINPENYQPKTLRTYLDFCDGRIPLEEAKQIAVEITAALDELHSEGLVHRDIKPDNILCVEGRWELADIGFVSDAGSRSQVGTIGYMSPEGPGKPTADILSLGKVFYEISSGNDVSDFPDYPSWVFDSPDDRKNFQEFNDIVLKATDPIADNRFENAAELLESLLKITHQQTDAQKEPKLESRSPFIYSAVLVLIVGFVWYFVSSINQTIENNGTDPESYSPQTTVTPLDLPENLRHGLVAYYPLDGNARDVSGNKNHGDPTGVTWVENRHGNMHQACWYDGNGDFIDIKHSDTMSFDWDDFTISIWLNYSQQSEDKSSAVFQKNVPTEPWSGINIFARSSIKFRIIGHPKGLNSSHQSLDNSLWNHFVFIKKGDKTYIYINGQLDSEQDTPLGNTHRNNENIRLGANLHIPRKQNFNGAMDDLCIYDRALLPSEVEALYKHENTRGKGDALSTTVPQSTNTVDKPSKTVFLPANLPSNLRQGLVAYYPFNGNAKDESGNGYHAKIYEKVSLGQDRHSKAESAYYFDGQLGYMKLPIKAMEDTGDACTVSLWVNPLDRSPNSTGTIF
jgi:serine/threonine protein kinase